MKSFKKKGVLLDEHPGLTAQLYNLMWLWTVAGLQFGLGFGYMVWEFGDTGPILSFTLFPITGWVVVAANGLYVRHKVNRTTWNLTTYFVVSQKVLDAWNKVLKQHHFSRSRETDKWLMYALTVRGLNTLTKSGEAAALGDMRFMLADKVRGVLTELETEANALPQS